MENSVPTLEQVTEAIFPETASPVVEAPAEEEQPTITADEQVEETASSVDGIPGDDQHGEVEEQEETKVPLKALQEERRKRQEYEAKLREYEDKMKPQESSPVDSLINDYLRDPQGTESRMLYEIARMEHDLRQDPYADDAAQKAMTIEQARMLAMEVKQKAFERKNSEVLSFQRQLEKEVPGLAGRADQLTEFAVTELGYDINALGKLTDYRVVGPDAAIQLVKQIDRAYQQKQAAAQIKQKVVAPKPTQTETPGTGAKPASTPDMASLMAEARRTGNWEKYLDARGVL